METALRDPYMGITEASKLLGVNVQTIKKWVASGKLHGQAIAGRLVVTRESVEAKCGQKKEAELEQHIGITEASRILQVSTTTIKNWLASGRLKGQWIAGRRVIDSASVQALKLAQ